MELEAEADGILGRIDIADGQRANVGQVIAVVLADGETLPVAGASRAATAATAAAPLSTGRKHAASPLARRLAAEAGLDLQGVTGSGPRGRIVKLDVQRLLAATPAPVAAPAPAVQPQPQAVPPGIGPHEARPLSNMRRTIARRLVEAKTSIPHFYLSVDCELDALLALRAQVNEGRDKAERISINDFVIKAAARALRKVPAANVIWNGDEILQLSDIDISVAVATDGGLITPILRGADRMSLGTLSAEMKALAARAHQGELRPEEYQGGGFSVSNLGMYGIQTFSAIINPPQSCILAVGASLRRPVGRGDQIVLADVMSVTLSVDHRSVDGALGAQVLAAFKNNIENPMSLLI